MNFCSIKNLYIPLCIAHEFFRDMGRIRSKTITFDRIPDRETSMSASLDANLQELVVLSTSVRTWVALEHFWLTKRHTPFHIAVIERFFWKDEGYERY